MSRCTTRSISVSPAAFGTLHAEPMSAQRIRRGTRRARFLDDWSGQSAADMKHTLGVLEAPCMAPRGFLTIVQVWQAEDSLAASRQHSDARLPAQPRGGRRRLSCD